MDAGSVASVRSSPSSRPRSAAAVVAVPRSAGPMCCRDREMASTVREKPSIAPASSRRVGPCDALAQVAWRLRAAGTVRNVRRRAPTCLVAERTPHVAQRPLQRPSRAAVQEAQGLVERHVVACARHGIFRSPSGGALVEPECSSTNEFPSNSVCGRSSAVASARRAALASGRRHPARARRGRRGGCTSPTVPTMAPARRTSRSKWMSVEASRSSTRRVIVRRERGRLAGQAPPERRARSPRAGRGRCASWRSSAGALHALLHVLAGLDVDLANAAGAGDDQHRGHRRRALRLAVRAPRNGNR